MAGGSNGYRAARARRQRMPGLISSLLGMAGFPPSISFSTSCLSPPSLLFQLGLKTLSHGLADLKPGLSC